MGYTNLGTVTTNSSGVYYNYVSVTSANLNQSFKPSITNTDTVNAFQFYGKSTGIVDVYLKTSGGSTVDSTTFNNSTLQWQSISFGYNAVTSSNTYYLVLRPRSGVTLYAYYANNDNYSNGTGYQGVNAGVGGTALGIDLAVKITCYNAYTTPTVTTTAASSIATTSATTGGNVTSDGGATVTGRGVVWGTVTGTYPNTVASGSGTGVFNANITGLTPGTDYFYKAYATNADGTSYGAEETFTTTALPPTVTISAATNVDYDSADLSGNATDDHGSAITEKGFVYNTTGSPTTADTKLIDAGTGEGAYADTASGLTASTTYYVKAYAINAIGTGYSAETTFTTTTGAPDVTTGSESSVATTSFTMGGTVVSDRGSTIISRGFVYNTSTGPTLANSVKTVSGTTGAYSGSITGLSSSTKYYIKAYATNAQGTNYGAEVEVVTLPTNPSNLAVTAVGKTTASLSWTKGSGSYSIVRRQTGSYPANSVSGTSVYSGTGGSVNDSGLTAGETYYYRVWSAYNVSGTPVSATPSEVTKTTIADFTNPTNVYADDGNYATASVADGVVKVRLSKDAGVNWTTELSKTFGAGATTEVYGSGATELWGSSWTVAELGANFRLMVSCGTVTTAYQIYSGFDFSSVTGTNVITGLEVSIKGSFSAGTVALNFVQVTANYGTSAIAIEAGSLAYDTDFDVPTYYDGSAWTPLAKNADIPVLPVKATGAEVNTGTDDAKFVTPKAVADSNIVITDKTQTLTNKTLTSPKINENVAVTSTATELNILDGVTSTYLELNITDGGETTEKVLNTQCKCRAYLNSQQSNITDDTWTKVLLDTENYDVGADFDTANSRFVAPVTGYYQVNAGLGWSTVTDKSYYIGIYVNGSLYKQHKAVTSTTGSEILTISDTVFISSGQYIELYGRHISAASTPDMLAGSETTNMSIHLLSI